MPAVSVEHLAKSFGAAVAVRDVSFEVQKREVFALLGPKVWGAAGVWVGLRRWDWSPKRG